METQAQAPAPAQAQTPVNPILEEAAAHEALTNWVKKNPDNDPEHPTDSGAPRPEEPQQEQAQPEQAAPEDQIELPEDEPLFEIEYKTDAGKEAKKLSLKELREGYLAKQDYHRNIQKVKAEEQALQEKIRQADLTAQQQYLQRLEQQKQLVLKTVAPELQNVDLNKLAMEDPAEAQRLFFRQIQLNQTLQAIESEQRQAHEKLQSEHRAAIEQAKVKSRQTLESDIPGWGEELYSKVLGTVAKDYGFKNEEVEPVVDARLIKVFHDAFQYRQLQKAKPEVSKRVVAIPKVIKPGSADKPNPASEATHELSQKLKKSGDWRDAAALYLAKQKQKK